MTRTLSLAGLLLAAGLALPVQAAKPEDPQALRQQLDRAEQSLREAREQLMVSARDIARIRGAMGEDTPFARALGLMSDPRRAARA